MEKHIQALFNDQILHLALAHYAIQPQDATILDGFESFIYNVHRDGQEFILRIGHDGRRTPQLVQGEAEFLNHLAGGGLSVPQVLPSLNGNLVEAVKASDDSHFLTTLFEKAEGHPTRHEERTPALFRNMGMFLGKLHRLSQGFAPSQPAFTRFGIDRDMVEMAGFARKYLPTGDGPILEAYTQLSSDILSLPKSQKSYGLCHIDFHYGNFFITDEGKITLFDFDDCQYAWFVYDIAMSLFYAISLDCTSPDKLAFAQTFLTNFWEGYRQEFTLDPVWLLEIPKFLRLREIDLYIAIYRSMDVNHLDPWCASFMKDRQEKILKSAPYCGIDYRY